jgi:hypothetical protein
MRVSKKHSRLSLSIAHFRNWLFLLLVGFYCQNTLSSAIFYQPQSSDSHITTQQWNDLLEKVYKDGYREIVIQWTQYGSISFVAKKNFLREVIHIAQTKKFKIWLGLYLPNDYYQVMENSKFASAKYFKSTLAENKRRLSLLEIQSLIEQDQFAGWYLPMEITHKYFQQNTKQDREIIIGALQDFISSVKEKIAISYFLSKSTTYKSALSDLTLLNTMGFNVWLQKGNGLKKQTVANRLIKRMDCDRGIISENFIQTSNNNTPFEARKNNVDKALDSLNHCHKRLTFSLRYLPYSPLQLNR